MKHQTIEETLQQLRNMRRQLQKEMNSETLEYRKEELLAEYGWKSKQESWLQIAKECADKAQAIIDVRISE